MPTHRADLQWPPRLYMRAKTLILAHSGRYARTFHRSDKAQAVRVGPSCAYNPPIWQQRIVIAASPSQKSLQNLPTFCLTAELVIPPFSSPIASSILPKNSFSVERWLMSLFVNNSFPSLSSSTITSFKSFIASRLSLSSFIFDLYKHRS